MKDSYSFSNVSLTSSSFGENMGYCSCTGPFTVTTKTEEDKHYDSTIQPLEFMQANMSKDEFVGFLKGNVIKYVSRAGKKAGCDIKDDLRKAKKYLSWLTAAVEGKTIDPRRDEVS